MRDDEMVSAGYSFKCVTQYDNEEYFKIQDIVSKFMEMILGKKF